MSIPTEIERIRYNVANSYNAVRDKGGTLPGNQNSENLEEAIRSIPVGVQADLCTIDLQASEPDGGTVIGGGLASPGMKITVEASPANKYTFEGWKENNAVVSEGPEYTFRVTGDRTLVADFSAILNVTISATVDPSAGGTVTGAGSYEVGDEVTLTYEGNDDYTFDGWYSGNTLLSAENPYIFVAAEDMDITAKCEEIPTYTITLTPTGILAYNWEFGIRINETGGPSWTGSGAIQTSPPARPVSVKGGSVTVFAYSPEGYEFASWQIDSGSVVTDNPYTFNLTSDITLYANYEKKVRLPSGYTEVEYVYPTGVTVLNTGITPSTSSTHIVAEWMYTGRNSSSDSVNALFGGTTGSSTYFVGSLSNTSVSYRFANSGSAANLEVDNILDRKISIDVNYSTKKITVDGKSASISTISTPSGSMFLFASMNSALASNRVYARCYSFKVYNSSTLIADFVPCVDSSGQAGLYDITRDSFYIPSRNPTYLAAGQAV